jgi:nucleotide-binding universal stress UspA family protein
VFDRILVPLDGSSLAECVLPHVVALARPFDAHIILLRTVVRQHEGEQARAIDPLSWEMRKSEAEAYLAGVDSRLQEVGLQAEQVVLEGKAAERIVEFAHSRDVDLIVLSSHGRGGLSRWNINSVVQKVILRVYAPVLIVRAYETVAEDLGELRYKRLMVPLDGSQRAEYVLPVATALAGSHECPLLLAHVVSRPTLLARAPLTEEERELVERLVDHNRGKAREYLDELESRLSMDVESRLLVSDHPAAELHKLGEREEVDLVILSAHGQSGESQWPYGATALNFIAYGTTPLLIVQDISQEEARRTEAERAAREQGGH